MGRYVPMEWKVLKTPYIYICLARLFIFRLRQISAKNHFTMEDVNDLLLTCQNLGLEVIPLIQTFGHLEFILKHREYAYLRYVSEMPESSYPCYEDSLGFISEMVN